MLAPIAEFLVGMVSQERYERYVDLLDTMEVYVGDSFNTIAQSIIVQDDAHTKESLLQWFDATIGTHLDWYVSDYGIVARYADLRIAKNILDSLFDIERYEDYETILSIINDEDEDNEFKFARILQALYEKKDYQYIEYIDSVSDTYIDNVRSVMESKQELYEEYREIDPSLEVIRKRILKFPEFNTTYIYSVLKSGAKLGFDLNAMLDLHIGRLLNSANFVDELIAFILASKTGPEGFLANREDYIYHLGLDDHQILNVMAELSRRLPNYAS